MFIYDVYSSLIKILEFLKSEGAAAAVGRTED